MIEKGVVESFVFWFLVLVFCFLLLGLLIGKKKKKMERIYPNHWEENGQKESVIIEKDELWARKQQISRGGVTSIGVLVVLALVFNTMVTSTEYLFGW